MVPTEKEMISWINKKIKQIGKRPYKQANSAYGVDWYQYNGVTVGLADEGYTDIVIWGDRLYCYYTYGRAKPVYRAGNCYELEILYYGMGGPENL